MEDQPRPIEDEVERALASMRAGFLSGSEQITAGITSLDDHLQISPPSEELEVVRAAVSRLAMAHELLLSKVGNLPASSWDSFKVLVAAVKAQQTVLDQVSHLVKEHVLPRQLESLSAPPAFLGPGGPGGPGSTDAPPPGEDAFRPGDSYIPHDAFPPHDPFRPHEEFSPHNSVFPLHESFPPPEPFSSHDGFRAGDAFQTDDMHANVGFMGGVLRGDDGHDAAAPLPLSINSRPPADARADRHALAPARRETGFRVLADAGLHAPRDRRRIRDEPRQPARRAAEDDDSERVSFFTRVKERTAGFRGLAAMIAVGVILSVFPRDKMQDTVSRLIDLIGPGSSAPRAEESVRPRPKVAAESRSLERVPSAPPDGSDSADPMAGPAEAGPPFVQTPLVEPVRVADAVAEERFVPVVFTHKDHTAVVRALADLKQQYANVLVGREGEVQPVDMGKKGIWHRLVFLPAGPRPQAAKICDQLAAQGYDRCWVQEY